MSEQQSTTPKPAQNPGALMGRGNPMGMMMPGAKAKNFGQTMKSLFGYMRMYWVALIVVVVFAIASTIFAIASPKILGRMTNQIVDDYTSIVVFDKAQSYVPKNITLPPGTTGAALLAKLPAATASQIPAKYLDSFKSVDLTNKPGIHFDKLRPIAIELIVLYALSAIFSYAQGIIMTNITQKVTYRFRQDISTKIGRLPLKYFDKQTYGEVLSRVTNDVDTVSQSLNQSLTQIITAVTTIIGILIMMLTISWLMTLVALVFLPLSFLFIALIAKRSQQYFKDQQVHLGHMNGHIEEMFGGHVVVRVFNGERRSVERFNAINKNLYESGWKSQFLSGLMWPITNVIGNLSYVAVSVLGGYLAINGRINIGDIQAFIQYVSNFNQPVIQTANIASVLQSTAAAAERVFEFLAEAEEQADPSPAATLTNVKGNVEFNNVVFGYNPDKIIINNFSAKVRSGQRIAIVGPTGAGKTTMVNLLMRFYELNSGAISIDGVDTKTMKRHDVRKLFGMVLQDTWLFNGTIKENLAYSKQDATDEEIEAVAKAAHVDHFVHALPDGYNTVINEDASNISQGEKQLLTIARSMLANPPMLILDEATSSVDTRTELLIQQAMNKLMVGRTSFVIAHRLSTIRDADLILVMRDGSIVEQGNHEALLKKKGFYATLYNSQFADAAA